jgi:putative methyltransferase (TIGR04325 family)
MATTESTRLLFFAFAYVLARIAAGRREMSVLDFGGNVGSYALVARSALPDVEFRYTVQELPAICAAARRVRPWVRFVSADAELADAYDLVVSSGSLQYIEDWRGLVPRLAARASPWLYLARLPIVLEAPSFPVRQSLGRAGDAMFWCINRRELLDALPGVTLVHEFRIADGFSPIAGTPEMPSVRSYLFRTSPPFTG